MEKAELVEADLSKLDDLSEDSIRQSLKVHYERDRTYSLDDTVKIPPGTTIRGQPSVSHIVENYGYNEPRNSDNNGQGGKKSSLDESVPKNTDRKESKKKSAAFWDVCRVIARERRAKEVHEKRSLQVIKTVTYILLFCILLWCTVCQKISLMVLASSQYDRQGNRTYDERDEHAMIAAGRHMLLTLAILIPYFLVFMSSTFKWLFGNYVFPAKGTLIMCCIAEFLHSVGLGILCFLILPEIDIGRGIMLLNGAALIPAIVLPVCGSKSKITNSNERSTISCTWSKIGVFILSVLAIIIQYGYIPVVLLTDHFLEESTTDNETWEIVLFVIAIICISLIWWETFMDDRFCGPTVKNSCWHQFILSVKFDLQESKPVVSFFMSLWKIGLTVLISWLTKEYCPINTDESQRGMADVKMYELLSQLGEMPFKKNTAILTLTLSAFVGHYIGQTACKLKLQKVSYNMPLILSTPTAVLIVSLDCSNPLSLLGVFTDERVTCPSFESDEQKWSPFVAGFFVWLSIYWIGRHIFYPNIERLAKTERLYQNPFYCGILFEQHLVLNRRRHNRKVKKDFKEDKVFFRLSEYDSRINVEGEEEDGNSEDGQTDDVLHQKYYNPKFRDVPMIYACATMWHENRQEMMQLMKSVFRMDKDQCLRRHAELITQEEDKTFYDFEAHIFFDDCMEMDDNDEMVPNQFVKLMVSVMSEAVSSVYEKFMTIKPPYKVPSPYGGQLIFILPGDNFLFIHLKDKQKVRQRKRWSQVMYMYYLLGFRIVRMCQETVTDSLTSGNMHELVNWQDTREIGRSHIFQAFDEQVVRKADNTFLLALDGDVDFRPGAVRLLLDKMRKSEKVGAACGRIHPIGSGPIVWFQKFEYAIAHWLQKATEHVLGSVLYSPGCFTLFRGSALMDDNVMKKYTNLPTKASQYLMYDQGEDRWLCTLLLQQGYRIDYAAGSDAFTYAPQGFEEFFNQRRRWMPSTFANIVDLLADYKNTIYVNSSISMLYIFYQASLLLSTVIGPATVLMMMAGANTVVFRVNLWYSYLIALIPAFFYFGLCFVVKPKLQIFVAEVMTAFYAFVMMIVLVGTIVTAAEESPLNPSVLLILVFSFIFVFAAVLHPKEWTCVIYGVLYFLLVPTGFLLLTFYSLCNIHNISWGTREVPKRKSAAEIESEKKKEEVKKKNRERGFFARFLPQSPMKDLKELLSNVMPVQGPKKLGDDVKNKQLLNEICRGVNKLADQKDVEGQKDVNISKADADNGNAELKTVVGVKDGIPRGILKKTHAESRKHKSVGINETIKIGNDDDDSEDIIYDKSKRKRDELKNPAWSECKELGNGKILEMAEEELTFWEGCLDKYLLPLTQTDQQKKATSDALIELRNNVCLGMAMINLLWIAINFMFQLNSTTKIKLPSINTGSGDKAEDSTTASKTADNIGSFDGLGLMFIVFFLVILLVQCVGMIIQRWGTFMHLVSVTQLRNPFSKLQHYKGDNGEKVIDSQQAIKIMETMLLEPLPDYPSDEDDDSDDNKEAVQELESLGKTGSRFRVTVGRPNIIGASTRQLTRSTNASLNRTAINKMAKNARILQDGLRATRRNTSAPYKDDVQWEMQDEYRKRKDSKYKDRALPPIKSKSSLNLDAGRSDLQDMLRERNLLRMDQSRRALVDENDDEDGINDIIQPKGTISRHIGKKMKLFAKTGAVNSVTCDISESGRPNDFANRGRSRRPVTAKMC